MHLVACRCCWTCHRGLNLPQGAEGLAWLARQGPARLLLIPGVQAANIAAAARGDQQALACLRITAQQHAAGIQRLSRFQSFKLAASRATAQLQGPTRQPEIEHDYRLMAVYTERLQCTGQLMAKAVQCDQLAALRWLRALCQPVGFARETELMRAAARGGHLETLQFLRSGPKPTPWDTVVSSEAAKKLDCLKWLLSQEPPCPCDDCIIFRVAEAYNLEALKWLRTFHSIPLSWWRDPEITELAASTGSPEMLKSLRAQDPPCPWDETCAGSAAR